MTEQEWITSQDPVAMLEHFRAKDEISGRSGRLVISNRKLCLFAVNCCRQATVQAAILRDIFIPFAPTVREGWQTCGRCSGEGKVRYLGDYGNVECPACHGKGRVPSSQLARWLAWNDGTVKRMAESIYDERAFDRLPLLADALEEAGCEDVTILTHCRGFEQCPECPSAAHCRKADQPCEDCGCTGWRRPRQALQHVRGCWVIDLLLGME